jgi:activating signal cointegrator 1
MLMKALSLLQPWAGLAVLGIKEFETRSRNTHHRGLFAVHSSARMTKEGKELLTWLTENMEGFQPGSRKYIICTSMGVVLGHVELVETYSTDIEYVKRQHINNREMRFGNYSPGRYFYKLKDPLLYAKFYPVKGMLGFWNWNAIKTLETLQNAAS